MWLVCDGEYEQWGPVCAFPTEEDANAAAEFYNGWVQRYDNFSYSSFDEWRADHPDATKYEPSPPVEPIKFVHVTRADAEGVLRVLGWKCLDECYFFDDEGDCPHWAGQLMVRS